MKRIILATTIAAASFVGPALAEQYVCNADQTSGFRLNDSGRWQITSFNNADDFLVDSTARSVSAFGEETLLTSNECSLWNAPLGPNTEETHVVMRCSTLNEVFTMLLDSKRFTYTYSGNGYIFGDDYPYNPTLTIGRCAEVGG